MLFSVLEVPRTDGLSSIVSGSGHASSVIETDSLSGSINHDSSNILVGEEGSEGDLDDCDKCPDAKKSKSKSKSKSKKGGSSSATPAPAKDTTPPTVTIISPANGATVSGSLQISATASDNKGITKVEFFYGTKLIKSDLTAPYSITWDTKSVSNGVYSITAKAYDGAGNKATSQAVSVTVNNSPSTSTTQLRVSNFKYDADLDSYTYTSTKLGTYNVSIDRSGGSFYIESISGSISVTISHTSSSGTVPYSFSLAAGDIDAVDVSKGDSLLITLTSSGSVNFTFEFVPW